MVISIGGFKFVEDSLFPLKTFEEIAFFRLDFSILFSLMTILS